MGVRVCGALRAGSSRLNKRMDRLQCHQQIASALKRETTWPVTARLVRFGMEFEEDPIGSCSHRSFCQQGHATALARWLVLARALCPQLWRRKIRPT